ncbi:hypothetical protein ACFTTN_09340 [Streptomyces niveus]|uniref:Uncharacterized protein n=1 Tax=Streptomyces niveus TaxID=193462 RepID=A0A1U9QUL8_STRNV|nr:hypothetical protein [Streptomyces niveus]AQU67956.1 hypothetical protein BBN63_18735 [Streptomyces niveus]
MPVDRYPRAPLRSAITAWRQARIVGEGFDTRRTGLAYHLAVNRLHWYISLLRTGPHPRPEIQDELTAACHALTVLSRESMPAAAASGAHRHAVIHARIALAAGDLADPAHGVPQQVARALEGPALDRFDPYGIGTVTPAERIAGAAEVRMVMARLIVGHPPAVGVRGRRWLVTEESGTGISAAYRDRRDFRRAVLPSCAGLDAAGEAMRLGAESVGLHAALARRTAGHFVEYDNARKELGRLSGRLGVSAPVVE